MNIRKQGQGEGQGMIADQTQRWLEINLIGDLIGDWKTGP